MRVLYIELSMRLLFHKVAPARPENGGVTILYQRVIVRKGVYINDDQIAVKFNYWVMQISLELRIKGKSNSIRLH
jgi:hypothetical protein